MTFLVGKRASEGLAVKAVSVEEIARVFGHGTVSGEAIPLGTKPRMLWTSIW